MVLFRDSRCHEGGGGLTEIKIFALKSEETRKRENMYYKNSYFFHTWKWKPWFFLLKCLASQIYFFLLNPIYDPVNPPAPYRINFSHRMYNIENMKIIDNIS